MNTFDIIVSILSVIVLTFFGIGIFKLSSAQMRELRERFDKEKDDKGHSHA
jgi:hypothetical protein